jgi:phosphoribosyl-ATP pyrophosphohydrolase
LVTSIDLMGGEAVQLVGGREKALSLGDPRPIAERFARTGEVAVVDLDAAIGSGSNAELVRELVAIAPCRVGGGIRSVEAALDWLDAGATKVVLGTAATPEVLRELPPERVVAALDADRGEVVVEGWRKGTGRSVADRMRELEGLVGGYLVTFVEREGRLGGSDLGAARELAQLCGEARLTVAGGVTTAEEIAALDAAGADAQIGMALYTGRLGLAEGLAAPLRSDRPDGLWPTLVVDEQGVALGLAWSDLESLREALDSGRGVYRSRQRGLWRKGASSGDVQDLLRVDLDCDRDALRFTVRQHGRGFCHVGTRTCFGADAGLGALARRLAERARVAPEGSYTAKLLGDPAWLRAKLVEEAGELADAREPGHVAAEAADLLYFACVALARAGLPLARVEGELERRAGRVRRRPGLPKAATEERS